MAELITKMHWHMYRPVTVQVDVQGSLLQIQMLSGVSSIKAPDVSSRGIVTHFSRKSRKRMLDTISRMDRKKVSWGRHRPKFVTLTYDENVTDFKKAKRDLKVFVERMQERYPKFACLWRMEQQERGAIHFHIMMFGTPFLLIHSKDGDMGWQQHWNAVCGNSQDNKNSFDLEVIDSMNGVAYYVAKYMAKTDKEESASEESPLGLSIVHNFSQAKGESTGRWWGVYGRKNMPYAKQRKRCFTLPLATLDQWLREHVQSKYASVDRSWTVYRNDADDRYEGLLSIIASLSALHDDMNRKHVDAKRFFAKNWRENSFMPMNLWQKHCVVVNRNKKAMADAEIAENMQTQYRLIQREVAFLSSAERKMKKWNNAVVR